MSYTKTELHRVITLCSELSKLATEVIAEANECTVWDSANQRIVTRPQWPYWGGTKASGAMRRKSMELTRALADLRRS